MELNSGLQEAQLVPCCGDGVAHGGKLVAIEVVHDLDVARGQHRDQHLADIGKPALDLDGAVDGHAERTAWIEALRPDNKDRLMATGIT